MTRAIARNKAHLSTSVALLCPSCGKRLDRADEQIPGVVDTFMDGLQWAKITNEAGEKLNWWQAKCPRSGCSFGRVGPRDRASSDGQISQSQWTRPDLAVSTPPSQILRMRSICPRPGEPSTTSS